VIIFGRKKINPGELFTTRSAVSFNCMNNALDFGLCPTHDQGVKEPHWSLERVKDLAEQGKFFVQRTKAMNAALSVFSTPLEVRAVIKQVLIRLDLKNYSETVKLTWDVADIYGIYETGLGWYLKITIDEEMPEVAVISFHPLERSLRTVGGMVAIKAPETEEGE
jgi:hypothetical protein